ncbi:MAG: hypothetical protein GC161_14255 [Planctomycetaceae bacterium]|nr:hypothetical protein [Planctomycetaceae bacterium]
MTGPRAASAWLGAAAIALCVAAALWWGTTPGTAPEAGVSAAAEEVARGVSATQLRDVQSAEPESALGRTERDVQGLEGSTATAVRSALTPPRTESSGAAVGVQVLVVGADRQPREGVEVVLRLDGESLAPPEARGTTGVDGKVWLRVDRPDIRRSRWVELAGPGESQRGIEVDPFVPRAAPVVLVVGDGAGLDVRVVCELGSNLEGVAVRLIAVRDLDAAFGSVRESDPTRVGTRRLANGVARWSELPPHSDFTLVVEAPSPLGPKRARVRTAGPGERAALDVVYSSEDVVLLGRLRVGAHPSSGTWTLWNPVPKRAVRFWNHMPLAVEPDGGFCVRLANDEWQALGPGACLVVALRASSSQLWAASIPPIHGPGRVELAEFGTSAGTICAGWAEVDPDAPPPLPELGVEGRLPPHEFAAFPAQVVGPFADGSFRADGELPSGLDWRLACRTPGWGIVGSAEFVPGDSGVRIELQRLWPGFRGRLVPGQALAASPSWAHHLHLRATLKEGPTGRVATPDADGSFSFDVPPGALATVSVHTGWHRRPLFTTKVVDDGYLELRLPDGLRVVELDVRAPDGTEVEARVREWGAQSGAGFFGGFQFPPTALLDLPTHDLVVESPGYLDTPVLGVVEGRRVDLLGRSVPIRLHAPSLPDVPEWVRLRPQISGAPDPRADVSSSALFDGAGWADVLVAGTGEFYVHLYVELSKEGMQTGRLLADAMSPRILVVDPVQGEPPPVHTVAFDLEAVQRAIDSLR